MLVSALQWGIRIGVPATPFGLNAEPGAEAELPGVEGSARQL